MNGYGEFFWIDGKKYFGLYKEDKREGFGLHYQPNKYIFAGFWKDGQKNGLGKYIKGKSVKYGIWKNGKKVIVNHMSLIITLYSKSKFRIITTNYYQ